MGPLKKKILEKSAIKPSKLKMPPCLKTFLKPAKKKLFRKKLTGNKSKPRGVVFGFVGEKKMEEISEKFGRFILKRPPFPPRFPKNKKPHLLNWVETAGGVGLVKTSKKSPFFEGGNLGPTYAALLPP